MECNKAVKTVEQWMKDGAYFFKPVVDSKRIYDGMKASEVKGKEWMEAAYKKGIDGGLIDKDMSLDDFMKQSDASIEELSGAKKAMNAGIIGFSGKSGLGSAGNIARTAVGVYGAGKLVGKGYNAVFGDDEDKLY